MKPKYIKSPKDLVTPIDVTQNGFLQQALRKTTEASPYIDSARQLLSNLQLASKPQDLIEISEIRSELVTAAGFSDKATNYFSPSELTNALLEVLQEIENKTGLDWRAEIVYRFLLTRGDTLGGAMRDILGAEAKAKFIEAVELALHEKAIPYTVGRSKSNEEKVQTISWPERILLFDKKPKLIGKNVDVILLQTIGETSSINTLMNQAERYLVCGEIKGGIDPAGADEHWKTASGALARIREKFPSQGPRLFFVGAAIENSMADEIFSQLNSGLLEYAANLNVSEQLSDLVTWLVSF